MESALGLFTYLLGQCWSAPMSATDIDTHCFSPIYGSAHVRDRHAVTRKGKAIYEGETIYSFDGSKIVFTYVNSIGGVGQGTAVREGAVVSFEGAMQATPQGKPQPFAVKWTLREDGYDVAGEDEPVRTFRAAR